MMCTTLKSRYKEKKVHDCHDQHGQYRGTKHVVKTLKLCHCLAAAFWLINGRENIIWEKDNCVFPLRPCHVLVDVIAI